MEGTNDAPAPNPTAARKSEMPISRNIILADEVVKITILYGPKYEMSNATMSDPPAKPNLNDCDTPGMAIGSVPSTTPKAMPMNIGIRFGTSRRLSSLPKISATFCTSLVSPTTMMRSPSCRCKFGRANKSMPARLTRVMVTRYCEVRFILPIFCPFHSGFVTTMRRDTRLDALERVSALC